MEYAFLKPYVKRIVNLLVARKYDDVVQITNGVRLSSEAIREAIEGYGRDLVVPPDSTYDRLDVVEVHPVDPPRWSIRCELWTVEEGRSDLTLELTVTKLPDRFEIELDDIHVL